METKIRSPLVIGNWKLNGSLRIVRELILAFHQSLTSITKCVVVIAPPEIYLYQAKRAASGSSIVLGAQNVGLHLSGAFTGETSAEMLKDVGVKYVIIGHSERRMYHKESNELIAKKFNILKTQGLVPVLCIGETESENTEGKTEIVCSRQIDAVLEIQGVTAFRNAVIAYEPIWAIGTGKPASPDKVQKIHKFIRDYISRIDEKAAEQLTIQYGGSVDAVNSMELFSQPDIDGALVGRASLSKEIFPLIIKSAELAFKHKENLLYK